MPRVGFEPTISAGERPKTYALDRAATGTGKGEITYVFYVIVPHESSSQGRNNVFCAVVAEVLNIKQRNSC